MGVGDRLHGSGILIAVFGLDVMRLGFALRGLTHCLCGVWFVVGFVYYVL